MNIRNIVFACPEPPEELGMFWAQFLGWKVLRTDWFVIAPDPEALPRLAFGDGPGEYRPPRWPDPDYPQQMHVDIAVPDLPTAADQAISLGAKRLRDNQAWQVLADRAGHPFCLHQPHDSEVAFPTIRSIVLDCYSPRALAGFYEGLLGMKRVDDSADWVVLAHEHGALPTLAFQQAVFPAPRWPDPAYPQQMHLDFDAEGEASSQLALSLGAMPLPQMGGSCPVFADPAGHPFCLCSSGQ